MSCKNVVTIIRSMNKKTIVFNRPLQVLRNVVRPAVDDEGAELLLETSATPPLDPEEEQHAQQQQQQQ